METVRAAAHSKHGGVTVSVRCPACRKNGTFDKLGTDLNLTFPGQPNCVAGQRRCPDPECHAHLLFRQSGEEVVTYPPETIDFDASDLPDGVPIQAQLFQRFADHDGGGKERAVCVAQYRFLQPHPANAEGDNLVQRINALRDEVTLAAVFFDGLHDLRLLGNDAAHPESRTYETVDKEVVEIALGLTKQVLQAVYPRTGVIGSKR